MLLCCRWDIPDGACPCYLSGMREIELEPKHRTIDAEPRQHSHLYELKPMSRWWLVPAVAYIVLCLFVVGFDNLNAYACVFGGVMLTGAVLAVFPRFWLSKIID